MSIGSRIKELREGKHISRNEFADMIGVTVGAISNYENDLSSPKEPILFKIIEALECEPNYIFQDMVKIKALNNDVTISEYDYIKKYRFISQYSINGTKMVDAVLDKEYMMAENRKNLETEIKELKSRLDSEKVHMPEMPNDIEKYEAAKKAKELTEHSKHVNKDTDYVNAAHSIAGASEEDKQFDEDIMNDEYF